MGRAEGVRAAGGAGAGARVIDEAASVTFPPGWATSEIRDMSGFVIDRSEGRVRVFRAALDDGAYLLAITYSGGRRMARVAMAEVEPVEPTWDECQVGDPGDDTIAELWDVWVECCATEWGERQ